MIEGVSSRGSAMPPAKVFALEQYPEPLPPGLGSTDVFAMDNIIAGNRAVVHQDAFILRQMPEPLPSGAGNTDVFVGKGIIENNPPMPYRSQFLLQQYPPPRESGIGKEDLPGGFRWYSIISGQANQFQDIARGIVQIDGVKVLFDAKA